MKAWALPCSYDEAELEVESESGEWERKKKMRGEQIADSKLHKAGQPLRGTPAVARQPFPLLRLIPAHG